MSDTALAEEESRERDAVRWHEAEWGRVEPWEYATTAVLMGGAFFARFGVEHGDANWRGGILFDDAFIDAFAIRSEPARANVFLMSDLSFYGSMAFRLVDSTLVPGIGYGDWDLALQMSMIDLEAFAVVAAVLWGSQLAVRRERPYVRTCESDPEFRARNAADDCDPQSGDTARSFIAGHTAVAITAAGLTCMHHSHVPLYGGGIGDDLACGVMIAQAAANGLGRVLTEKREYLGALPNGLESHPECRVKADVFVTHRAMLATAVPRDALPAPLADLVHRQPGMWIPDVHGTALVMLMRDAVFRDDAALMRFTYDAAMQLFENPLYRMLMRVLSPTLILSGVGLRWGAFRTGSTLEAKPATDAGGRRTARLTLTTPPALYPRLMLDTYAEAFRASIEMSGTKDTRVVVAASTPSLAHFDVSWRI